jgi:hypothetical protein
MRQSRFTQAQIYWGDQKKEAGMPTAEVYHRHGRSSRRSSRDKMLDQTSLLILT